MLVHGIGAVGKQTDLLSEWLGAMCAGSPASVEHDIRRRTAAASYHDWSWTTKHGTQGPEDWMEEDLSPDVISSLDELAWAWLEAAAASRDPSVANEAAKQQSQLTAAQPDGAQGPMRLARSAIAGLAQVPVFGSGTYSMVERVNRTNLWQVTAYVNDYDNAKSEIWQRFGAVAGSDTRVVVGHSLGSVVAYEAVRQLGLELDLLLTIGSPLGLDRVIYPKLTPDASFPEAVSRWVNVADRNDFIAADPTLADRFPDTTDAGRRIEDIEVRNRGPFARYHDITEYLRHDEIRAVFWEALDG